ncbi:MAG: hypothetical protein NZ455_16145 [Bacteroidia bacterium]|nr:hypothetical protein [Bacteroidia bacterium]
MGVPLAAQGSGHSALRFASVLRCASHCLTACSMPLTQMTCVIMSLPCLSLKYKYLQAKTLHNTQRNNGFRDPLREACEGWALAQCVAKRSTEALA